MARNLGFDGENVVRTGEDNSVIDWTFIHGPNTDDPVLGRFTGTNVVTYFVTDGQRRQCAALDKNGADVTRSVGYSQGGKYAGGTASGAIFDADRHGSSDVPGLSFFRNRVYDQATGRWTQEDPIGVAGGLNLYQFNGNNPVAYSDPFGLCPEKDKGNCTQSDLGPSDIPKKGESRLKQVLGAVRDFLRNRDALGRTPGENRTSNTDKFYHCMANCEAAARGSAGDAAAQVLSDGREGYQVQLGGTPEDSAADQGANAEGRAAAQTGQTCRNYCQTRFPPTRK